jgi:hypothetical protein
MTETENLAAGALSAGIDLPAIEPGIVDTLKTMIEHPQLELLTIAERTDIGLLLSAALLTLGVTLIVDWRRKRRAVAELKPWYCERSYATIEEAVADGFDLNCLQHSYSDDDYLLSDLDDDGRLVSRMGKPLVAPP